MTTVRFEMLGAQLARVLRSEIVAGRLQRGDRLVETALSERFDVSRGPVRDALKDLEAEGLVRTSRKGSYVVGLGDSDIAELYSLRTTLEAFATELVVAQGDAVDWEPFDQCLATMEAAAERGDAAAFAAADLEFHGLFYRASRHQRLLRVWEQMVPTFGSLLDFTNARDHDLHPALESHRLLLEASRLGRLPLALDELRRHLAGSHARIAAARAELLDTTDDDGATE